jgi:hypothetical protein
MGALRKKHIGLVSRNDLISASASPAATTTGSIPTHASG